MADLEKVIDNLKILRTWCAVNPRHDMGLDAGECEKAVGWLDDALALLKAQQPRVLTVEEVIKHYSLPPAFPDDFAMQEDYYEDIQPLYFEFPHDNEDPFIVHWRGHAPVARYLDEWKHTYGKKWRCWNKRPTDAEKKEVAWE